MEARLAHNSEQSQLSAIRETFKSVKDDPLIANLCIGDPSFRPPPAVLAAFAAAVDRGLTHYENDAGMPGLRDAVSAHESQLRGVSFDPYRHIVITNGATNGIYSFSRAVLDPGDEVLLLDPVWIAFIQITKLLNCKPILVRTRYENNFFPDHRALEEAVTERTKMLVVISPGNPTGAVYGKHEMEELLQFCSDYGLWLLHDEAYRDIVFGDHDQHSVVGFSKNAVGVRTVSKSHAMTGFRVGWVLSTNEELISRVRLNVAYNVMCVSTAAQAAALAALNDAADYLSEAIGEYERRMVYGARRLRELGFELNWPRGSFYLFPRHNYGEGLSKRLLREAQVAVVDGHHFGPSGKNHFRISCCVDWSTLETGLDRIAHWTRRAR